MFGMNNMTTGFVVLIIGLVILGVQWFLNSRKVKPQELDPINGIEKLLQLIKEFGLGTVIAAVGLFIMAAAALAPGGGGTPTAPATPASASPSATVTK